MVLKSPFYTCVVTCTKISPRFGFIFILSLLNLKKKTKNKNRKDKKRRQSPTEPPNPNWTRYVSTSWCFLGLRRDSAMLSFFLEFLRFFFLPFFLKENLFIGAFNPHGMRHAYTGARGSDCTLYFRCPC